MEPRQYLRLSEILLVVGILCAVAGIALIYSLSENTLGAIVLIIGCALALVSLPTFIVISVLSSAKDLKK